MRVTISFRTAAAMLPSFLCSVRAALRENRKTARPDAPVPYFFGGLIEVHGRLNGSQIRTRCGLP